MKNHLHFNRDFCLTFAAAAFLGIAVSKASAGTAVNFSSGSNLGTANNYSNSALPTNTTDVKLTTSTAALTDSSAAVTMESLTTASTTTTYTITISATGSLTLGNAAGFTNANNSVVNDLIAVTGNKNLTITGNGTAGLILASSGNFDATTGNTLTVSSNISQSTPGTSLTMTGAGTVVLGGTNSFSGGLVITGGETDVSADSGLGAAGGSITINGGRLGIQTNSTTIDPTRAILLGANATGSNTSGTLSTKGATVTVTYNGVLQNLNGSTVGDLVKQGAGTLQLGGVSTYSGNTFLNNGTTKLTTGNDRLPAGTTVYLGQAASTNAGTLDLNGFNQQIAGLNTTNSTTGTPTTTNTVTTSSGGAILTLSGSGNYSYGGSTVQNSGIITGAISLAMTGSGTQTLAGANTFTGTTSISTGKLVAANTTGLALGGTSSVSLTGGTLILGASNQINTLANITLGGGTFALNNFSEGSAGTAGIGSMTLSATSTLDFGTLGSGSNLVEFGGVGSHTPGASALQIMNYDTGSDHLYFTGADMTAFTSIYAQSDISFNGVAGYAATSNGAYFEIAPIAPVPEPATILGGLTLLGSGLFSRRRARRA